MPYKTVLLLGTEEVDGFYKARKVHLKTFAVLLMIVLALCVAESVSLTYLLFGCYKLL